MKQTNWYKVGLLALAAIIQIGIMYHGIPAALDNLAAYRLEGMTQDQANCIARHKDLLVGLDIE
jgi:hypothetical protein